MKSSSSQPWVHDREHIRFLHHAHADQIESLYQAMQDLPGNPHGVVIQTVGSVRTLLARGDHWENRAILHGDETHEQIDEVLAHFKSHHAGCVIELNVANSYVNPPADWEARLLPHLLACGCKVGGMRCVWVSESAAALPSNFDNRIERFGPGQICQYASLANQFNPNERWTAERLAVESRPGLMHYVGFDNSQPCALGSMFVQGSTAYLSYWETLPSHRRRGFQKAGIQSRVADAFEMGCTIAFSVSDYNFSSAANLQKCGFQLAYNYLVVKSQ